MGTFSDLRLSFRRATLLLAVLAAATFPALAAAETTQLIFPVSSSPVLSVLTNPCTGESVALEGFIHFYSQTQSDGTMRFWFNSQDVKGTALATGARYIAQNTEHTEFDPLSGQETYLRIHLVRKAETATTTLLDDDDDFHMRAILTSSGTVQLTPDPCR